MNIQYIKHNDKYFPELLRDIASPPKGLYVAGSMPELPMIAMVGTRSPSDYGKRVTYQMASNLAKAGFCLVSGMAMGIDTIVHRAALDAGGATVAVLGSGVDCPYPRCNHGLYESIIQNNGAVISEYENGTTPFKSHFPARNRIISGLSLAVIVTEADAKSGSLITANFALQQNRTVMAIPGNITSLKSAGPNNLIKSGASAVTDYTDVLALLGLENPTMVKHKPKADSKEEATIIELLSEQALSTEQLISKTGLDAVNIASVISLMEITGKIRNLGAGLWITT